MDGPQDSNASAERFAWALAKHLLKDGYVGKTVAVVVSAAFFGGGYAKFQSNPDWWKRVVAGLIALMGGDLLALVLLAGLCFLFAPFLQRDIARSERNAEKKQRSDESDRFANGTEVARVLARVEVCVGDGLFVSGDRVFAMVGDLMQNARERSDWNARVHRKLTAFAAERLGVLPDSPELARWSRPLNEGICRLFDTLSAHALVDEICSRGHEFRLSVKGKEELVLAKMRFQIEYNP